MGINGLQLTFVFLLILIPVCLGNVVIQIPEDRVRDQDGFYRLDYWPPHGNPPPNSTFTPKQVVSGIELTRTRPGTKYDFNLYYRNGSISDWPTWTASITTVPMAPSNLSISVRSGKVAQVSWEPPEPNAGGYSHFKLKVIPLSEPLQSASIRNVVIAPGQLPFNLRDLTPGASYELQLYTVYEGKESASYISSNFTTRPNAPGRFIVWYRNQTTMLVLWQPPYPHGIYSSYRVSINPPDDSESVQYVKKDGDPPGPAQASFHNLVSGRAYNITVETVSNDQVSFPTTAQYRTVPPIPENLTVDGSSLTSDSFTVVWETPKERGEFDSYQLNLGVEKQTPLIKEATEARRATFNNLRPGHKYTVFLKTLSGNVASWTKSKNVTTRPLKVESLFIEELDRAGVVNLTWSANEESLQNEFKIVYQEVQAYNGDSRTEVTRKTSILESLNPGRNYSVSVYAVSNGVDSHPVTRYIPTRPAIPIIEQTLPIPHGLKVSWKSDVNSKQDRYVVTYTRNDTDVSVTLHASEAHSLLQDLYPGAGYEIKVYAISRAGLWSEPDVNFQAVYPNPVRDVRITDAYNTSLSLDWLPPEDSIISNYVVRYRTVDDESHWHTVYSNLSLKLTVNDLIPGERYVLEVRSVSDGLSAFDEVESLGVKEVHHTIPPNPVSKLDRKSGSSNITFEWSRPEGRIDFYTIIWWKANEPDKKASKDISGDLATEGIERKVAVLVGELMPGELYNFELFTTANSFKSKKVALSERTVPLITSELTIVNHNTENPRSFTVRYTRTPFTYSVFDMYRFVLSDSTVPVKEKSASDDDRKVIFDNLIPGRLYNITAWTVSGGVTSKPLVRQNRLFPDPVRDIKMAEFTSRSITLSWKEPFGDYEKFKVTYILQENEIVERESKFHNITIENLIPYQNYTFTIVTLSDIRQSTPVSASFTTLADVPGQIMEFDIINETRNSITFRWYLPPEQRNGVLHGYNISYYVKGTNHVEVKEFPPDREWGILSNLIPGKTYIFEMSAINEMGAGLSAVKMKTLRIDPPPKPDVLPSMIERTPRTIKIRFRKHDFSSVNGDIVNYSIIVAESPVENERQKLKSWFDVQNSFVWPPYQVVAPYNPFHNRSIEEFVIGSESHCNKLTEFCNGPLKPGTPYKIKIRAYTFGNKYTDTDYSEPVYTEFEGSNVGIAVAIPVVLILLIVVGFILFTQRRKKRSPFKRATDASHRDDVHSLSDSIIETSRPVKLRDFADHYRYMSADSDFRFSEEYEALKNVGRGLPCVAADLPVNRPKNRFTNILPFDHSRVKLQPTDDEEGTDYINANYVSGFNSPREFIVTQGPLVSTRDDFWRMCWETNSRAIVMLTRCVEKGREKCDHYWPGDTKAAYYGDIQVTILNESHYADWTVTEFRVCKGDVCRIIRHFHFTTWPDFGVPDPPQSLVRFVRAFRERCGADQKPIVLHCSAGVGRSGTFIALDRILQSIRVCDYVDIFGIVYEMRRERIWMVQNEQQYICIHQCLLVVIEGRENEQLPKEIHDNQGFEVDEGIAESGM